MPIYTFETFYIKRVTFLVFNFNWIYVPGLYVGWLQFRYVPLYKDTLNLPGTTFENSFKTENKWFIISYKV